VAPTTYDFTGTVNDVRTFIDDAANNTHNVHTVLEKGTRSAVSKLLLTYGLKLAPASIPAPRNRRVPTQEECRMLLALIDLGDQYAVVAKTPSYSANGLAPLMMVIGHAMPLVATVDAEVAAAG
jgi:hypothetical protein